MLKWIILVEITHENIFIYKFKIFYFWMIQAQNKVGIQIYDFLWKKSFVWVLVYKTFCLYYNITCEVRILKFDLIEILKNNKKLTCL